MTGRELIQQIQDRLSDEQLEKEIYIRDIDNFTTHPILEVLIDNEDDPIIEF